MPQWKPPTEREESPWPGKLVEEIRLENGLVVEIWDYSRRQAGDRWLVGMLAQIKIPVTRENFPDEATYQDFLESRGPWAFFRYYKERTFVDERLRKEIFSGLVERFKGHSLIYLAHPEFASRFLVREIEEFIARRLWDLSRPEEEEDEEEWKDRPI
ncbi:hypothetical protein [Thermosulfuriphilus sp.]